jgi:hypothetical protein
MASIESTSSVRRRNKSLKIKTSSSSIPLVNRVSKISSLLSSSSSRAIEVERSYFPMVDQIDIQNMNT